MEDERDDEVLALHDQLDTLYERIAELEKALAIATGTHVGEPILRERDERGHVIVPVRRKA